MNPERFGADRDYASDRPDIGMSMNVFHRVFLIRRNYHTIRDSIEKLQKFQREYSQGELSIEAARGAMTGVKTLMRSMDSIEYAFPELRDEVWFSGFQSDVHHAYWRVEDGKFNGVLEMDDEALHIFSGEVTSILSNVSDSINTNPINQLERFFERYGDEFSPGDAPDEYYDEIFEARDLFCLGYFSTGLIVLGRAVERALLDLGRARKIASVDGFRSETDWEDARFFERTEALYVADMPDMSGKMLTKRQYHHIQLLIDYRNQVAHNEYRQIPKDAASRMMGQALDILTALEERRAKLEEINGDEIRELENLSIPL